MTLRVMSFGKAAFLAATAISILCASSLAEEKPLLEPPNSTLKEILSGVPDVRQSTNYSCGVAAFQAVLSYWGGEDLREDVLMKMLNTTPQEGTPPENIVRAARDMGYEAEFRENLTLEDLEASVRAGVPVVIVGQAWRYERLSWRPRQQGI
jgi:predicted double-glycine peptidase